MRILTRIIQYLVGVLFIVSGLVKANDPLGLGYKMQEFFELWNSQLAAGHFFMKGFLISLFDFLHEHALALSIIMITLEILAGVALIMGHARRFITWFLLVLIVFFTFLTGYAYLSGKFTNCGCFGDCLPITPLTSFTKDIVLLLLILELLVFHRHIHQLWSRRVRVVTLIFILFICIQAQWFVLHNLPFFDCLPFAEGNALQEQMKPPKGSVPDSFAIRFTYEKAGKTYQFDGNNLPADIDTYTYKDRKDELIRKGNAEPALKGFTLTGISGIDSVQQVLAMPAAYLLFNLEPSSLKSLIGPLRELQEFAGKRSRPLYLVTTGPEEARNLLAAAHLNIPVFSSDYTVIRIAARSEPTLYILKKGKVVRKYGSIQATQPSKIF